MPFGEFNRKPNILILITDQQSGNPHWPEGWELKNLPAMTRLKENGLAFKRGYTNSCTCSPSRVTMFTGLYPAQHGVNEVLEMTHMSMLGPRNDETDRMKAVQERRQRGMQPGVQNLAKMLKTAGYNVVYKGKWHLTKPTQYSTSLNGKYWTIADEQHLADRWGIDGWNMPDAGDNLDISNMGGGRTNNDGRFISGEGESAKYGRVPGDRARKGSVLTFLEKYDSDQPFCLIVSLVNPHDVLAYPGTDGAQVTIGNETIPLYQAAGYRDEDFTDLPIELPPTFDESLDTKPKAQEQFRVLSNAGNGTIGEKDFETGRGYCQFYAYLCARVDNEINRILDVLDRRKMTDDTVIFRVSDHGDMAMAHGRQRQKMFNIYEQTLNVPFVVSNPRLFKGEETHSLASLIDIMPTLASIGGVPERDRWIFKGKDLSPILECPRAKVQNHVHFTYEDLYFYVPAPNHIRCITEEAWKYGVYYDVYEGQQPEYEMYNLATDPHERHNLANAQALDQMELTLEERAVIEQERQRLHRKLTAVMDNLGTTPPQIIWPQKSGPSDFARTDLPKHSAAVAKQKLQTIENVKEHHDSD